MSKFPTRTELTRPLLPTKTFKLSKRFCGPPGFENLHDADVAVGLYPTPTLTVYRQD
jgi:hypothetical protein